MAHEPGSGTDSASIRSADFQDRPPGRLGAASTGPASPVADAELRRRSPLFPALCVNAPRSADPRHGAAGIFAARASVPPSLVDRSPSTLPQRSCLELPAHLEPTAAWREIRAELRRAVGESTYEIWLDPLEVEVDATGKLLL